MIIIVVLEYDDDYWDEVVFLLAELLAIDSIQISHRETKYWKQLIIINRLTIKLLAMHSLKYHFNKYFIWN